MLNLFGLVAIIVLLAWLSVRAWRTKSTLVKWGGTGLAGLSAVALALICAVMIAGLYKLHSRNAPTPEVKVTGTAEQIGRGQAIAVNFCAACHSKSAPLTGGYDIGKDFSVPIGSFVSANLTPAGSLRRWSDGQIFRAIRNSVDAEDRWLYIMSLTNAGKLSDGDIESLIAYIRSLPAAGQETASPLDRFSFLGLAMLGAGMMPQGNPVFTSAISAPPKGPNARYGEYIVSYQDCRQCHGANLSGGVPGQLGPLGPCLDLVKEWKREEFIAAMRTGIDPSGHEIDGKLMPWGVIGKMDDDELSALYEYLTHLPGSRATATN
jgi:mono/diheme cytochrome c family protein